MSDIKNGNADLTAEINETKALLTRGINAHNNMKQVNKYYRKKGTCKGYPGLIEEQVLELDSRAIKKANCPFDSRELEKSNKDLAQLRNRLMCLQDQRAEAVQP